MLKYVIAAFLLASVFTLKAQDSVGDKKRFYIDGQVVTAYITDGDTLIVADLDDVSVSSIHDFGSKDEYRRYLKYRYYANKVYPYAVEAIKIFRQMEYDTKNLKKRKRRKHLRKLNKRLKKEFKQPLKKLSKTQGLLLTKMIERHLDKSMHHVIKENRGGFKAFYWHNLGKLSGYDLKHKYVHGEDKVMDVVLQDFDISYEITSPSPVEDEDGKQEKRKDKKIILYNRD